MNNDFKKKVIIVGAGQIGSRYLQGLAKYDRPLEIIVIDHNQNSIELSKKRWLDTNPNLFNHKIYWNNEYIFKNDNIDLIIISTSSNEREKLISKISKKYITKYWILEKVLAQCSDDVKDINFYTKDSKSVWVNTSRRAMSIYSQLKIKLNSAIPDRIIINGGLWGLACNSIHFIDLVEFLTNQSLVSINTKNIDKKWIKSKREGYFEITGELSAKFSRGTELILRSKHDILNKIIRIELPDKFFWIIDEAKGEIYSSEGEKFYGKLENQSDMTTNIVKEILENGLCKLTSLKDSSRQHVVFLDAILNHWNNSKNKIDKKVPIT